MEQLLGDVIASQFHFCLADRLGVMHAIVQPVERRAFELAPMPACARCALPGPISTGNPGDELLLLAEGLQIDSQLLALFV